MEAWEGGPKKKERGFLLLSQTVLIRFIGDRSCQGSNWWDLSLSIWLDNVLEYYGHNPSHDTAYYRR